MTLDKLLPIIVSSSYFVNDVFQAPHCNIIHKDLSLTWVLLNTNGMMTYITKADVENWESKGINWKEQAFNNLIEIDEYFYTHEKRDDQGELIWVAFMNSDGLGSSRLLRDGELLTLFPDGYLLAIPDRSMGLAFPSSLNDEDRSNILSLISNCYINATIPMMNGIIKPHELFCENIKEGPDFV